MHADERTTNNEYLAWSSAFIDRVLELDPRLSGTDGDMMAGDLWLQPEYRELDGAAAANRLFRLSART